MEPVTRKRRDVARIVSATSALRESLSLGGSVARPRLDALLDLIRPSGVGLISASAGSGKSVLMGQWSSLDHARAQLRILPEHDDAALFARALTASITAAAPDFDASVVEFAVTSGPHLGERFTTALLAEVERMGRPLDLMLDDVHRLTNSSICSDLEVMFAQLPDNVRVVVASRWDPPIGMRDLRLAGRLIEVRAAELAFDVGEARELVASVSGRDVTDQQVEALVRRTGGWAVGLQLAAISLGRADDVDCFIMSFSGNNQLVAEYLMHEVLADTEPELERFLLRTSVLSWLTPELCDAVTGSRNGHDMIRTLTERSLFVTSDADHPERLRYHELFADLLRYQLVAAGLPTERQLRLAAASWLLDHGHRADGIEQLLAAGEPHRVNELLGEWGLEWADADDPSTLARWLSQALSQDPHPSAPLLLNLLGAQVNIGRAGDAIETYRRLRSAPLTVGERAASAALYSVLGFDDLPPASVRSAALEALELVGRCGPDDDVKLLGLGGLDAVNTIAATMLAIADLHDGRRADSIDHFESAMSLPGSQYRYFRPYVRGGLAFAHAIAGHSSEAQALAQSSIDEATANHVDTAHGLVFPHFALAIVAIDRCDNTAAIEHLYQSNLCAQLTGRRAHLAFQRLLRADQVAQFLGPTAALEELDPSNQFVPSQPLVIERAVAQELRLLVATGQLAKAHSVLARHPGVRVPAQIIDLELAAGRVAAARTALDGWVVDDDVDRRSTIERLLREAAVLDAERRPTAAGVSLRAAVDLAEPELLRRPFLEQSAALRLLHHEAQRPSRTFERSIVERVRLSETRIAGAARLAVPLTARELEVLDFLPTRHTNAEIADALYVSLNTLKSHLSHIYAKLCVTDRDQAVARAIEIGLL